MFFLNVVRISKGRWKLYFRLYCDEVCHFFLVILCLSIYTKVPSQEKAMPLPSPILMELNYWANTENVTECYRLFNWGEYGCLCTESRSKTRVKHTELQITYLSMNGRHGSRGHSASKSWLFLPRRVNSKVWERYILIISHWCWLSWTKWSANVKL